MDNPVLVRLDVIAPTPLMHFKAAEKYSQLRNEVKLSAGFDFLGRCGDIYRQPNFVSSKDGVATRSWHKTGRAFDYDQSSPALVLVSEIIGGKQYFRTYLKCEKQDGTLGRRFAVKDVRGFAVNAYLFDFTEAAERIGFKRIPAWNGWQSHYIRREFWHYQFDEGLTWDAAMAQLRGGASAAPANPVSVNKVWGLNDRGDEVTRIQRKLADLGFLPPHEVDGVFGAKTRNAVAAFQSKNGLDSDGLVGPNTKVKLLEEK
jgi:hypothetical protein